MIFLLVEETEAQNREAPSVPDARAASCAPSAAMQFRMPTLFLVCLSGRQWGPFRVEESAWVPWENSNHSENNSNSVC